MPSQPAVFAIILSFAFTTPGLGQAIKAQDESALNRDLHYAVINGDRLGVRDLLVRGADPNSAEGSNRPPLFQAVSKSNLGIVKLLVEAGGDVNAQHPRQLCSILGEAAAPSRSKESATRVVRYLLDKGAKPDATALDWAARAGNLEVIRMLLERGVSPDAGLYAAAGADQLAALKLLLQAGADVDGDRFRPPLLAAAQQGGEAGVKVLLDAGANPNIPNENGRTPLHAAVTRRLNLSVVKTLVEAGARIDLANNEGITPIRAASIEGPVECYDWLLARCGGTEPAPSNIVDDESIATKTLLDQFEARDSESRMQAQRLLVVRGESAMPALLRRLDQGGVNTKYADLLAAMGPRASEASSKLESYFSDEEQVLGAIITLRRMNPHYVDQLPAESKQRAADSLLKGVHTHARDVYGAFYLRTLVGLGKQATPQLELLLRGESVGLRGGAAEILKHAPFRSKRIEATLIDLLLHDANPGVRAAAATGLQNPNFHSQQAKEALLEVLATPPIKLDADELLAASAKERKRLRFEQQAVQDLLAEASTTLASYGAEIIPQIRDKIAAADPAMQSNYEQVFDVVPGSQDAVAAFTQLLDDPNEAVRKSAHKQLARLANAHVDEAGVILVRRFDEGQPLQRREAAHAIIRIHAGTQAERYLPQHLSIVSDPEFDLTIRMHALGTALSIDAERVKLSSEATKFLPVLMQQLESGDYEVRLHAFTLIGKLGSAAVSAKPALTALVEEPLPQKPETLPKQFRPGIDDQPDSEYRKFSRERHAAEIIRNEASQALKAIKNDMLD